MVEHLTGETLIYDLDRDEAHHLNPTAAAVFELCDGRATVGELAARTAEHLGRSVDARTVHAALALLAERELLTQTPEGGADVSRREVVRKAALVGVGVAAAAPLIKSIVAPTPAQAQTGCAPPGARCNVPQDCCFPCCDIGGTNTCLPPNQGFC